MGIWRSDHHRMGFCPGPKVFVETAEDFEAPWDVEPRRRRRRSLWMDILCFIHWQQGAWEHWEAWTQRGITECLFVDVCVSEQKVIHMLPNLWPLCTLPGWVGCKVLAADLMIQAEIRRAAKPVHKCRTARRKWAKSGRADKTETAQDKNRANTEKKKSRRKGNVVVSTAHTYLHNIWI